MQLRKDNIHTIIFDMDGVITSELGYWKSAALTVYELLYDYRQFGKRDIDREWCRKHVDMIYDTVFHGGKTVTAVKELGVNTNWDLAYVVFLVSKYLEPELETFDRAHFESVCMFIENIEVHPPELYDSLAELAQMVLPHDKDYLRRGDGTLWSKVVDAFQCWYHGGDGVSGLIEMEEPLLPLEEIKETLTALSDAGFRLGIGTGRPRNEIEKPLAAWGLAQFFQPELCTTYDEVLVAQTALNLDYPLAKPHPFVFLKAAFGDKFSDEELCRARVKKEDAAHCLVVGDAASDMLAAKAAGFPFLAVLTGSSGQRAQQFFEENQADIIADSMLSMKELIEK